MSAHFSNLCSNTVIAYKEKNAGAQFLHFIPAIITNSRFYKKGSS